MLPLHISRIITDVAAIAALLLAISVLAAVSC